MEAGEGNNVADVDKQNTEQRPLSCQHYQTRNDVPKDIQKYWAQRYDIFSRYDEGIWLTDTAWYGVTPEAIADKIARHIAQAAPASKTVLIDTFAGIGGNTIAFARSARWSQIFAIEQDADSLACAKHNAALYGVANKIWWIHGDCFDVLRTRLKGVGAEAVVFGSPPWGGPGYRSDEVFRLSRMQPYDLCTLYAAFRGVTPEVVLYLPRSADLNEIAAVVEGGDKKGSSMVPVLHYCMRGASKALCVYFGNFDFDQMEI